MAAAPSSSDLIRGDLEGVVAVCEYCWQSRGHSERCQLSVIEGEAKALIFTQYPNFRQVVRSLAKPQVSRTYFFILVLESCRKVNSQIGILVPRWITLNNGQAGDLG